VRRRCSLLFLAQDQPVLLVAAQVRRHERPDSVELLPVQPDSEAAVPFLLEQLVRAVVPDLDGAGAVVPLRDLALERRVVERVVLDVHREVLLPRLHRHALRHRPARERAVHLEPEVVVQPRGVVPLHDEDRVLALLLRGEGLRRLLRVPLPAVLLELGHGPSLPYASSSFSRMSSAWSPSSSSGPASASAPTASSSRRTRGAPASGRSPRRPRPPAA